MSVPPRPRRSPRAADTRSLQKEETKARLIEAAGRAFTEHGYDNVSVSDIAAAAGVVPSLINTHFLGKGGLLYAVVQQHNAPQFAALREAAGREASAAARLDRVIETGAAMDLRKVRLLAGLQALSWTWPPETEDRNRAEIQPFFDLLAEIVGQGIAAGEFRDVPVDQAVEAIWAIYTMGLRPGVFGRAGAEACAARIKAVLHSLLRP